MFTYKSYVKILSLILLSIIIGSFIYIYFYSKIYPIPLFHRVSLDAKMKFLRDRVDKDSIDTIIIGSSIGLNNIQGITLEDSSDNIKHVLNLSSLALTTTQVEQLSNLIFLFPNTKRVIYSSQFEDWSENLLFEDNKINFAKKYIELGKKHIDLAYAFYTFKHLIEFIKHNWEWEKKYAPNTTNHGLSFDRTGSVPLEMYGENINHEMFSKPPLDIRISKENPLALERIIKKLQLKNIHFYFIIEPYRQYMIDKYSDIYLTKENFTQISKKLTEKYNEKFLDLHEKLHLGDEHFVDREHLNSNASIITAKEVAEFIDKHE